MGEWQPIETAPKDGRPVWARGWDWGEPSTRRHAGWVHWNGNEWEWSGGADQSIAAHLTDWLSGAPNE